MGDIVRVTIGKDKKLKRKKDPFDAKKKMVIKLLEVILEPGEVTTEELDKIMASICDEDVAMFYKQVVDKLAWDFISLSDYVSVATVSITEPGD